MATITTTLIPFSANDLDRSNAGVEWWNGQDYADVPASGTRHTRKNFYFRFCWTDIEKVTQGNYVWTRFDQEANKAFAVGAKFAFGFMIVCDSDDFLAQEFFNGSSSRYPKYVHDHMQTQSVKDYATNGQWIPAWNNTFFLDRFAAMLVAVREHIIAQGWQNRIAYTDIRGYGQWGEWHSVGFGQPVSSMPAGIRPTVATYKRFVDMHVSAFPNWPLVMMLAAMDAEWLDNTMTPKEVTDYVLKASNAWGPLGLRRDQWGATDNYIRDYLENNNRNWNGGPAFKDTIMQRWKTSPWVGEPMGPGSNLSDLERQVGFYHATSFGNGNYTKGSTTDTQVRAASKLAGYRLQIEGGSYTNTSTSLSVSLNWRNAGITPPYEDWNVVFELRSGNTSVQSFTSSFKPKLFQPSAVTINDTFGVSVPQGSYTLTVKVVDPTSYRKPMPLFINGVQGDGSYILGPVTITTGNPNNPPTVSAGIDRVVTTPNVTISGTVSDDGTVASTLWSRVSGSGVIGSPNALTTDINGLTAGNNTFRLTATDNQGLTASDDITITLQGTVNTPPAVDAGSAQTITLPTSTVTLTGTATDTGGSIASTLWTKFSGSGVITSPNNLTTTITGLTQGQSIFRLQATDNVGATSIDSVTITINPAVPQAKTVVSVTINTATYKVTYSDGSTEIF